MFPYKWDIYTQNLIVVLCIEWKGILDQWDFTVGGAILHNIPEIETKQLTKCPVAHHENLWQKCKFTWMRYNFI